MDLEADAFRVLKVELTSGLDKKGYEGGDNRRHPGKARRMNIGANDMSSGRYYRAA